MGYEGPAAEEKLWALGVPKARVVPPRGLSIQDVAQGAREDEEYERLDPSASHPALHNFPDPGA